MMDVYVLEDDVTLGGKEREFGHTTSDDHLGVGAPPSNIFWSYELVILVGIVTLDSV